VSGGATVIPRQRRKVALASEAVTGQPARGRIAFLIAEPVSGILALLKTVEFNYIHTYFTN
jgi:hypothetical protein